MGYAALCVDTTVWTIRGAEGFRANQLTTNQATIDFFEDAIRILDQRGLVDPQRVAVSGFSGSATGIAWGLVHSKAFTAAIITTRSGSDPIVCYLATMAGTCRRAGQRAGLSPPYDPVAALPTDSPALGAAAITTPLLMQLAEAEYLDNLQLHAALSDLDRPVELRVFPGEFHMKRQPRHRLAVYERNVQWIDFWLRGREETGANLSVQYKRWREQRELHCQRIANSQEAASLPWYCKAEAR
jgi:dipeptidyl aminopeptidase/acylaminoacyl peptidase